MKVLLIEDNKKISDNIKKFLGLENIVVDQAYNGIYGLEMFKANQYDLVLLDLMLPGLDGINIAKNIKKSSTTPIIMITAKSQLNDKLEGFDSGADDYLTKPFDLPELLARIKNISKRYNTSSILNFKNLEINFDNRSIKKNGVEVKLTLKEFDILELLIKNIGKIVSRTDIIESLWGGDIFQGDDKLDVYISNIRRKLGKELIETAKGFGYIIKI